MVQAAQRVVRAAVQATDQEESYANYGSTTSYVSPKSGGMSFSANALSARGG